MSLAVMGIGSVNACGSGIDKFESVLKGKSVPHITEKAVETSSGKIRFNVFSPIIEGLDSFIEARKIRRLDDLARMVLLSSFLAVEDSGIEIDDRSRVGVIFGSAHGPLKTTFGFLDSLIDFGDGNASPTNFANSVHNSLASQISIFLNITGPTTTITCFNHTVGNVFTMAENWLKNNYVDYVIAGIGDEYCDVLGYGFINTIEKVQASIDPFAYNKCSFLPGEGSVSFLLSKDDSDSGKYGSIRKIYTRRNIKEKSIPEGYDALFISSHGNRNHVSVFGNIDFDISKMRAYSPYYGSMDTGAAFEIAAALLSNRDRIIYKSPLDPPGIKTRDIKLDKNIKIGCMEYCKKDEYNLYEISN